MAGKQEALDAGAGADADDAFLESVYRALREAESGPLITRLIRHQANVPSESGPLLGRFWDFAPVVTWPMFMRYRNGDWYDVLGRQTYAMVSKPSLVDDTQPVPQSFVFAPVVGAPNPARPGAPQRLGQYSTMSLATWYGMPAAVSTRPTAQGKFDIAWRIVVPKSLAKRFEYARRIHMQMMSDIIGIIPAVRGQRVTSYKTYYTSADPMRFNELKLYLEDGSRASMVVRYYNLPSTGPMLTLDPAMVQYTWNTTGMDDLSDITRENVERVLQGYVDLVFKTSAFNLGPPMAPFLRGMDANMAPHIVAKRRENLLDDPDARR